MSISKNNKIEANDVSIAIKDISSNGSSFTITKLNGSTSEVVVPSSDGTIQIGMVCAFAANSTPSGGWLLCNGANVSRTTYAALFAVIGTIYGTGDGSTTFTLPNLADMFIQGSGTAGTVKSAGLPNITGTASATFGVAKGSVTCTGAISIYTNGNAADGTTSDGKKYFKFDASLSNSIYGANTTVQPPSLTMRYYIKY